MYVHQLCPDSRLLKEHFLKYIFSFYVAISSERKYIYGLLQLAIIDYRIVIILAQNFILVNP